jgi:hypothetical protein
MARIPRTINDLLNVQRPPYRSFQDNVDSFEDIDDQNYRRVEGDVVEYTNDNGTFVFKKHEVGEVIRELVDKALSDESIDLTNETKEQMDLINDKLRDYVSTYLSDMENRFKEFFYEKVEEVAEKLYLRALDSKIEEEVNKRLESKIDWIIKNKLK